jgi:hypothetical protein
VPDQIPTVEELRELAEEARALEWSPAAPLAAAMAIEIEALYFRAVDLVFEAIPAERWLDA